MNLGERLKELRKRERLTQEMVADKLKISRSRYANWENNESSPGYSMLKKLAQIYDVSVDYLLNGEPLKVSEAGTPYIVLTPEEMDLFVELKQLSEEDRKMVYSLVIHLRRKRGINEKAAGSDNIHPFPRKD